MSKNAKDYYIGLDCGTGSVGWAVTDEEYNLLRAKGKTLWGSRLFETANTASERRLARSSRRRLRRSNDRIKLLNLLFQDEMAKVDPDFYLRLKKSFLIEEDKHLKLNSKNTLFNDANFTDKDFHKKYPTIWHLRKAIIEAPESEHFDLRLYYLAIHHILKNRGHFLREGKMEGAGDFEPIFEELCRIAENFDLNISDTMQEFLVKTIKDQKLGIRDKRKELKENLFIESDEDVDAERQDEFAGLIAGSKITLRKIFESDVDKDALKFSFADGNFEDKLDDIETELGPEQVELIEAAKKVYDFGILSNLLGDEESISSAMTNNYSLHQKQLKELKNLLKPFKNDHDVFFKTEEVKKGASGVSPVCYNAYIGKAFSKDTNGRKKTERVSQEDLNKEIKKLLEKHNIETALLDLAGKGQLLPKQKGQAKGTIPQQLHHNELVKILTKLEKDFPSFALENSAEDEAYNTKSKKIASIHTFRIPYYCGPIKKDDNENAFSWADEEIAELVRPWNFDKLVDLDRRADKFIRRMTNHCTYLPSEEVLPKSSLLYQKYMVLNELNNLKINGARIDNETKQKIYERVFIGGELSGNITLKTLKKWLMDNGFVSAGDDVSDSAENKFLPKLSTHTDFKNLFGSDYRKQFTSAQLEEVVELITILNNEPKMLAQKIRETLNCSEENAKKLSKKSYKDWARFSKTFLAGLKIEYSGTKVSILDMLWNTNRNLMELLGSDFHFKDEIEKFNELKNPPKTEITYEDVKNLYCSPSVKRTIWQAIKIVEELVKVQGKTPKKIFLEATREENVKLKGKESLSRQKKLQDLYTNLAKSEDNRKLLAELNSKEPRNLQSKKLYLYFTQMGKCAYSGERIDLGELATSAYDIDHIYPRSKTKDDSITNNLVLVKAEYNREKTNIYPIEEKWRAKMFTTWLAWRKAGLITKEKFDRLVRSTPLTANELAGFISRQIVETSQSVKALRGLLAQKYPDTKIVLVKAGQVSDLRHYFANGYKEKETGRVIVPGQPEFIKLRALNDFHHAKDAYLNIVVGNVMSETFTDNPYKWLQQPENQEYSLNSRNIWRSAPAKGLVVKGWNYAKSKEILNRTMSRNDCLWTRMTHEQTGAISDLQLVGKNENSDGILPMKHGLDPKKYGGYRSLAGAHFALIECNNKKGDVARRLVPIPQIYAKSSAKYISENYMNGRIILDNIPYKALIKLNGFPVQISRKGSEVAIGFYHAIQVIFDAETCAYIKKVVNIGAKDQQLRGNYEINREKDGVSEKSNIETMRKFMGKLDVFRKMPELGGKINEIKGCMAQFKELELKEQCLALVQFLNILTSGPATANLQSFVPKDGTVGKGKFNDDMLKYDSAILVHQSPAGLFEREIDLKTAKPKEV